MTKTKEELFDELQDLAKNHFNEFRDSVYRYLIDVWSFSKADAKLILPSSESIHLTKGPLTFKLTIDFTSDLTKDEMKDMLDHATNELRLAGTPQKIRWIE